MGIPTVVADWVQIGLQIMVFWSAAIAWRRFLQGVLIGHRHATAVAFGTVIRLASGDCGNNAGAADLIARYCRRGTGVDGWRCH